MAYDLTQENDNVKRKFSFKVWGKVLKYTLKQWPLLVVLIFTLLLTTFYDDSFSPLMNKAAIDALSKLDNMGKPFLDVYFQVEIFGIKFPLVNFIGYAVILACGILTRSLAIFATFFITNYLEMTVMTSLRRDAFAKVQQLSYSYFDKTPSGWIIARMQNDASSIGEMLSWGCIRVLWCTFDIVFTLITMFTIDWRLSLIILALSPLLLVIVSFFNRIILVRHRISRNAYSNYIRWLAECISGVQTIKTLAIEKVVSEEAEEIIDYIREKRFKAFKPNAFFTSSFNVLSAITTALIIYVGAYVIGVGDTKNLITIANFVLFIGFVGNIYNPLSEFSEIFAEFVSTQASIEKITSLINEKPGLVDTPEVIEKYGDLFHNKKENFEPLGGDIYFNHVSFSYIEGTEVLHDLDLKIKEGTSVAIVGETGSGKSTTVSLLCRFYEPSEGEIDIDGENYLSRSVGWLRSNIGLVQQSPFVFSASIKENIRYGKLDATDEEIINACKVVGVHEFIMTMKNGYDTILQDQGSELSVGQKQLLNFARAIVRDPKIMILDEATSSIDTETEQQIQSALNKVLTGRTSLIIAHRLSTIVNSDRILVMSQGKIIEDGTHIELMNKKGAYYQLYMNQFKELKLESQINTYKSQIEDKGIKL